MDKPIDSLITNTFERRMREASRIAREFKAPQVTSGASGQLGYAVENAVIWDATVTLSPVPVNAGGFGEYAFEVTFTGDESQELPVVSIITEVTVNGHRLRPEQGGYWVYSDSDTYPWTIRVQSGEYAVADPALFADKFRLRWRYYFTYNNDNTATIRVKMRARSSSPGVLSYVRTM